MRYPSEPKWLDGRRYCPGCRTYLDPDCFPSRKSHGARRKDGLGTYCITCQRERDRDYQIARRRADSFVRPASYRETNTIHGSIPIQDRDYADRKGKLGREVVYLGADRPHTGIIAGVRITALNDTLVWVDFTDTPLRANQTDVLGVTLVRAEYLAFRQNGHSLPEPEMPTPEPLIALPRLERWEVRFCEPLWVA